MGNKKTIFTRQECEAHDCDDHTAIASILRGHVYTVDDGSRDRYYHHKNHQSQRRIPST